MTTYDNTNRWTLNKNGDKQQDSHSDYKGSINIDGKEYWLNGWIKQGRNGAFISGTVKPKEQAARPSISEQAQAKIRRPDPISSGLPPKRSIIPDDDMNGDGIPF